MPEATGYIELAGMTWAQALEAWTSDMNNYRGNGYYSRITHLNHPILSFDIVAHVDQPLEITINTADGRKIQGTLSENRRVPGLDPLTFSPNYGGIVIMVVKKPGGSDGPRVLMHADKAQVEITELNGRQILAWLEANATKEDS